MPLDRAPALDAGHGPEVDERIPAGSLGEGDDAAPADSVWRPWAWSSVSPIGVRELAWALSRAAAACLASVGWLPLIAREPGCPLPWRTEAGQAAVAEQGVAAHDAALQRQQLQRGEGGLGLPPVWSHHLAQAHEGVAVEDGHHQWRHVRAALVIGPAKALAVHRHLSARIVPGLLAERRHEPMERRPGRLAGPARLEPG